MCTSMTFHKNGQHFLARTMDFASDLAFQPAIIPRNFDYQLLLENRTLSTKYGFTGSAREVSDCVFADGVNEKGLSVAVLYYSQFAEYPSTLSDAHINLAPHEYIFWLLSQCASLQEVHDRLNEVRLVAEEASFLGTVAPLHFILSDRTGKTAVIETENQTLTFKDDPVHVMTNSPNLEWHLNHLNNYLFLSPHAHQPATFGSLDVQPMGQGTGSLGLPGALTSQARFIRAAFFREHLQLVQSKEENVKAIFKVLEAMSIPKGVDIEEDGTFNYTQYHAVFDLDQQAFYFHHYDSPKIFYIQLTEELLQAPQPTLFDIPTSFDVIDLTK